MNHHALEFDRGAKDAKLNALKPAFGPAYHDSVTVLEAVHRRLSEQDPGAGPRIEFVSVERHSRSRAVPPSSPAVEEFDAVDHPVVTAQVDGAGLAAGGNVVANLDLFTGPVSVTNHHALELDRGVKDAKLNALKPAFGSAYHDCVTIPLAVHRRLSEKDPVSVPLMSKRRLADTHQQQEGPNDSRNS